MEKYDLCVIGGGPAGYAGAMRAIDFGKKVILIEKSRLGGAGIFDGALASKTMWELSNKYKIANDQLSGDHALDIDFTKVKDVIDSAIFDRKFQLTCHMRIIHSETNLITYERGVGSFLTDKEIKINKENGEEVIIYAENTLIATGSRPRMLPTIPVDEKIVMTSNGIMHMDDFPESLVILGAGVIGCEFATMLSNFGKTKVYLIDKADRILPFEDADISLVVSDQLKEMGAVIHGSSNLKRMEVVDGRVEYELEHKDGETEVIRVDRALLSIGRIPNIEDLNLENAGVQMSHHGRHIGDIDTQTNVKHIFAVGDISGHLALVNVGEREARHAVVKMFADFPVEPIHYDNISTIMFLSPEVAAVGLNEQQAVQDNIPIKVAIIDYSMIARAIAMRLTKGFFKIIVSDDDEMKILGMRAVGEHASSAIQSVALLIYMNRSIDELSHMIQPHPSIVEGIQECVRMLVGKSIYKSSVFADKLKCYRLVNGKKIPINQIKERVN